MPGAAGAPGWRLRYQVQGIPGTQGACGTWYPGTAGTEHWPCYLHGTGTRTRTIPELAPGTAGSRMVAFAMVWSTWAHLGLKQRAVAAYWGLV